MTVCVCDVCFHQRLCGMEPDWILFHQNMESSGNTSQERRSEARMINSCIRHPNPGGVKPAVCEPGAWRHSPVRVHCVGGPDVCPQNIQGAISVPVLRAKRSTVQHEDTRSHARSWTS